MAATAEDLNRLADEAEARHAAWQREYEAKYGALPGPAAPGAKVAPQVAPAAPSGADPLQEARTAIATAHPTWTGSAVDNAAKAAVAKAASLAAMDAVVNYPADRLEAEFAAETNERSAEMFRQTFGD